MGAGLIFFFLSLKLRHETKLGRQHCADLSGFSFSVKTSSLAVLSLLHTELVPETYGVPCTDLGGRSRRVCLTSFFPLANTLLLEIRLLNSWSFPKLSRKRSTNFFFFRVGDSRGTEPGILSRIRFLLTWEDPGVGKLRWTGVLPRDGVKSALEIRRTHKKS